MSRYNLYTALIGVLSVFFMLTIEQGNLAVEKKIFFVAVGLMIFAHSTWTLYRALTARTAAEKISERQLNTITQITLLNESGDGIFSWELYGKTSAVIGKDVGENLVDIDLSRSPYAAMIDIQHAILNYADGNWYIEDLGSANGISVKKFDDNEIYRLSASEPCKLDFGDVIFIGMCQLKLE
ncbi:MAG: FHA domain-containing protein [Quinella sp. 1Q7]|nr:FHA domain-containing protein [Quinella sp. 1Q7]